MENTKFDFKTIERKFDSVDISFSHDDVVDISFNRVKRKTSKKVKIRDFLKHHE
jgi:hypothetical protein